MESRSTSSILGHSAITIINQFDELVRVASWVESLARQYQLSPQTVFKLELVLDEALPNIISYAYPDQENHEILISLLVKVNDVTLEIIDDGRPFNPFALETPVRQESLETAKIHGRGIRLIKSFTTEQEYRRIDQANFFRVNILLNDSGGDLSSATLFA